MKTPFGKECRYFYGDYYRGRTQEECRLLAGASPALPWKPDFCSNCPVPEILMANACQNLDLIPRLERPFPFIKQQVKVTAFCAQEKRSGFDPHVGCGNCHPLPEIFSSFDRS
jgi:hypothetical protein